MAAAALVLATGAAGCGARTLQAQDSARSRTPTTVTTTVVRLLDGSRLVGQLERADRDSVVITGTLGRVALPRSSVAKLTTLSANESAGGRFTLPSQSSRLVFGPTARVQPSGDGYIASHEVFLLDGSAGIGHGLSIGGGMSVIPGLQLNDNLIFALPKIAIVQSDRLNVAVGALVGGAALGEHNDAVSAGIAYGAVTVGPPTQSVTFGAGWGYVNSAWANRPALMLGGELRITDRFALVTENYAVPHTSVPVFSLVARLYGERMSGDLGFGRAGSNGTDGIIFPVLGLAIRF